MVPRFFFEQGNKLWTQKNLPELRVYPSPDTESTCEQWLGIVSLSPKVLFSFSWKGVKPFPLNGASRMILENLLDVIARLKTIEAQMQKMRNECQEREKIWEAVEREVNFLEEKAVIYRYKVMDTQSLRD
ncbi:hypothetical protein ANCDUO_13566 [Ancylostoma duodenale]|uniref:Uncharacterized protein n=1 Tax=Ancylostoma duodenale TaxID=51022 RepID=A0A0C2CIM5_9BILA|nr:hypothetical protein ANCDUO_13566 [Ancylostoma duodenale]